MQSLRLRLKTCNSCTITGTVFETGNPTRLQILTLKFGKQAIVILDEQLPRMDTQLVVPRTIKNGVAKRVQCHHRLLTS
jgi:hypothetical protein